MGSIPSTRAKKRFTLKNHIILGIDENSDIDSLLSDGIRQFYFGFLDEDFFSTYSSQTSLNRRYKIKEQFTSYEKIFNIIDKIHQKNGIIYLALNSFTSNVILLEYSKKQFDIFSSLVDGIIAANITIATFLKEQNYKNIVLSNLFGMYSVDTVRFLKKSFSPKKFILPRDISLEDIKKIVLSFPDDEFECFLFGDNCRFSESFCFSEHGFEGIGLGSLCQFAFSKKYPIKKAKYSFKQILKDNKFTNEEKKEILSKKFLDLRTLIDELALNTYEFNSKKIVDILNKLLRYDIAYLSKDKTLYIQLLGYLKNLEFPQAKELLAKLEAVKVQDNLYDVFHKTNPIAIQKTLEFFKTLPNIKSYKIPSRGRNFMQILNTLDTKKQYNYQESQYEL